MNSPIGLKPSSASPTSGPDPPERPGVDVGQHDLSVEVDQIGPGFEPEGTFESETFDVGVDNGTPVSNNYKAKDHFPFTGQIDKVVITLTGEDADQAKEINNTELVD